MSPTPTDRRRHTRFPLSAVAQYDICGIRGEAPIFDISSGGVRLRTDLALPISCPIRLSIDWPGLGVRISVSLSGKVVRTGSAGTAITIAAYAYQSRPIYVSDASRMPATMAAIGPK